MNLLFGLVVTPAAAGGRHCATPASSQRTTGISISTRGPSLSFGMVMSQSYFSLNRSMTSGEDSHG